MEEKIKLADKEFTVAEMPIGKRKFLVPAIQGFFRDLNKKDAAIKFDLTEAEYDVLLSIVLRAVFPQIMKDDLLALNVTDDQLFAALFVITEKSGLKRTEQPAGEISGETTALPQSTTTA